MTRFETVRKAILADRGLVRNVLATFAAVAVPTALRWALGPSANPVPFITYFPFILLAAVFLGWRWATLATLASAALVDRIFLARPWLEDPASDIAIVIFFALSCAVLILIGEALRRTVRQMAEFAGERELLVREMFHRVQNTISVVQALVKRTGSGSDIAQYRQELLGRLQALAQANRILRDGAGTGSSIGELIEQATKAFRSDGAIVAEGPDCTLPAQAANHLVLILHELCTNALKHGALSVPGGRVTISWTTAHGGAKLEWRETGGPVVSSPSRKGLGLKLMEGQRAFGTDIRFEPTGLVCVLDLVQAPAANRR